MTEAAQQQTRAEILERLVFENLVRGEAREAVLDRLRAQFDEATALAAFTAATDRIDALKASGQYEAAARQVLSQPQTPQRPWVTWIAIVLIVLGAAGSVGASLARGRIAMATMPVVIGAVVVIFLIFNRRRGGSTRAP